MKVTLAYEHHFFRGADGHAYTDSVYPYSFWRRYLKVFDEVEVVARVGTRTEVGDALRADGPAVTFLDLPDYRGTWELVRTMPALVRRMRAVARSCEACILRVPGAVGTLLWRELKREQKPFGAQIVGNPVESLAGLGAFARQVLRPISGRQLCAQAREAAATTFVTKQVLQRRYPPSAHRYTTSVSDVEIPDEIFEQPRSNVAKKERPLLAFIGSLAQRYKGLDVLIRALASCRQRGVPAILSVVGEGRFRSEYEEIAHTVHVADGINFLGALPSDAIFAFLRNADLFVHPARTEGLPRALLEAMAVGLPCIATDVGAIPDLLDERELVPAGDPRALADKIVEVLSDLNRLAALSARNREAAWEYRASARDAKLRRSYDAVLAATR